MREVTINTLIGSQTSRLLLARHWIGGNWKYYLLQNCESFLIWHKSLLASWLSWFLEGGGSLSPHLYYVFLRSNGRITIFACLIYKILCLRWKHSPDLMFFGGNCTSFRYQVWSKICQNFKCLRWSVKKTGVDFIVNYYFLKLCFKSWNISLILGSKCQLGCCGPQVLKYSNFNNIV